MTTRTRKEARRRTKRVYTPGADAVRVPGAPAPRAIGAALVGAATIAALVERWWFPRAWGEAGSLTSAFYYGDATRFADYALAIARGQLYDNGIPYHPPGWPLLIAAVVRWTGSAGVPVGTVKLVVAVLSGLSVGASALLTGEIAGIGALAAVALLAPFDFGHIVEGTVANSEAPYGLLVAVAAWSAWRWLRSESSDDRRAWAAAAALAGGAATLVRAEYLAAAILTAAFAWALRRRAIELAVYAAVFCAALTPTTVWHWRTLSTFNASHVGRVAGPLPVFAPVTSYGPFNFAMANHEDADGGPNRDHPMLDRCSEGSGALGAGQLDLACPAIYELYVNGYAIGARWLLTNPGAALTLLGRKAALTIGFLGEGFLADDVGAGVDGVRRRVDLVDPARVWLIPIRLSLIVAGLIALRRHRVALAVLAPPLAAFVASTLMFYGYVRLGVAYLPIVWILEGAGVSALAFLVFPRRADARTAIGVAIALIVVLAYERSARDISRHLDLAGVRAQDGALVQDETMDVRRR